MARGSHLHRPALGEIRRRRIHSIGGNRAGLKRTPGDAVDTPGHGGVGGVGDGGSERECFTKQHIARIGSHGNLNGGRWRRGRYGACASPAAAQSPRTRREENAGPSKPAHFWQSFRLGRVLHEASCFSGWRKGPHAFCKCRRRASESAPNRFSAAAHKRTAEHALTPLDQWIWDFQWNCAATHGASLALRQEWHVRAELKSSAQTKSRSGNVDCGSIDIAARRFNNSPMARPGAARRVKSYSAANGYVYQYYFYEVSRITRESDPASEFTYAVSPDRKVSFPLRIVVLQAALDAWAQANGRALTSSEEYAVAKMRLFQAFDDGEVPVAAPVAAIPPLVVDDSRLEVLLRRLDI